MAVGMRKLKLERAEKIFFGRQIVLVADYTCLKSIYARKQNIFFRARKVVEKSHSFYAFQQKSRAPEK